MNHPVCSLSALPAPVNGECHLGKEGDRREETSLRTRRGSGKPLPGRGAVRGKCKAWPGREARMAVLSWKCQGHILHVSSISTVQMGWIAMVGLCSCKQSRRQQVPASNLRKPGVAKRSLPSGVTHMSTRRDDLNSGDMLPTGETESSLQASLQYPFPNLPPHTHNQWQEVWGDSETNYRKEK